MNMLMADGRINTLCWPRQIALFLAVLLVVLPARAADIRPVKSLLEMRHDHVVIQKWDLSCGAAALATLLNYQHQDPVTEREIATKLIQREEYIANPHLVRAREGFSLLDLKQFVEGRGYQGIGYGRLSFEDLIQYAPIMIPISSNGYNHFTIFRGSLGNRVLLADPAWGNRTMTKEKLERIWLDFPAFGRVGFVVASKDGSLPGNLMAPNHNNFVMLR